MDLCLMLGLCYLADVSGQAGVDLSPRFPCNTFGTGGFILQTAATIRHSGHQLARDSSLYTALFRWEREPFHPPAAIHAEIQLLCISQQRYDDGWYLARILYRYAREQKKMQKLQQSQHKFFHWTCLALFPEQALLKYINVAKLLLTWFMVKNEWHITCKTLYANFIMQNYCVFQQQKHENKPNGTFKMEKRLVGYLLEEASPIIIHLGFTCDYSTTSMINKQSKCTEY